MLRASIVIAERAQSGRHGTRSVLLVRGPSHELSRPTVELNLYIMCDSMWRAVLWPAVIDGQLQVSCTCC